MSYDIWLEDQDDLEVLDWNYTSNCAPMWRLAMPTTDGLAGFDGMTCEAALPVLIAGIEDMEARPEVYRPMNPENGWGDFDHQLKCLGDLREAFAKAPKATIRVWR